MKASIKIFLILLCAIIVFFAVVGGVICFMIFVPQKDVNTSMDVWVELQKEESYLPAISEMGNYENIQCKYQHRDNQIISSDAYILRSSYSQENYEAQKINILNTYSFQDNVTDEIGEKNSSKECFFFL